MRPVVILLTVLSMAWPVRTNAQAGRLPVLDDIPAQAVCGTVPLTGTAPQGDVARILKLDSDSLRRAIRLTLDAGGRPTMLTDLVFGRPDEREQASIVFDADGHVRGGFREYHPPGSTPAAAAAERRALLPSDAAKAQALAAAVLKRCSR